jgi:uncharacterized protein (DUF1684 family)
MISPTITREELERDVEAYRRARVARLTAERGWLTLIGKVWLGEGRHTVGSDARSDVVLPVARAPARLGTLTVAGGKVRLEVEGEVDVFARGARIRTLELRSDADDAPDDVTLGSLTLQLLQRGGDFAVRIRDAESPVRRSFSGIPTYPIDPTFRIVARLEPFAAAKEMAIEDGDGRLQPYRCPGVVHFEKDGQKASLLPFFEDRDQRLFVLFSDLTSRGALSLCSAARGWPRFARLQQGFQPAVCVYPLRGVPPPAAREQSAVSHRGRRETTSFLLLTSDWRRARDGVPLARGSRLRSLASVHETQPKQRPEASGIAPMFDAFLHVEFPFRIVQDGATCSDRTEPSSLACRVGARGAVRTEFPASNQVRRLAPSSDRHFEPAAATSLRRGARGTAGLLHLR